MNARVILNWLGLSALAVTLGLGPATKPGAKSDLAELSDRQQNLLLQLSDAEANIQAINSALRLTGYKVGQSYSRIDSNLKGNELMDRKGGGPVRWDEFYGKTAKDYGNNDWGDRRPRQFQRIYDANNDQINRAKEQITSFAKDQTVLLARRQKHEADQSLLWATIAWEQIKDREIELHSVCRFALKPRTPEAAVLRPVILFLRTANQLATEGPDSAKADQSADFQSNAQRMDAAFTTLQRSLADALENPDLKPEHLKQGQALKALCKELAEECKVITDNYANALDRDKARQDSSKLEFRSQLQSSLSKFSAATIRLDDEVLKSASAWGIEGDKGVESPDHVAVAGAVVAPAHVPAVAPIVAGEWIDLFNGKDLTGWEGLQGLWSVKDGVITGRQSKERSKNTDLIYTKPVPNDFELQFKYKFASSTGNSGIQFRSRIVDPLTARVGGYQADLDAGGVLDGSIYDEAKIAGGRNTMSNRGEKTYWDSGSRRRDEKLAMSTDDLKKTIKLNDWNDGVITANGNHITISINGQLMTDLKDDSPKALSEGVIALQLHVGFTMEVQFKDIKIRKKN